MKPTRTPDTLRRHEKAVGLTGLAVAYPLAWATVSDDVAPACTFFGPGACDVRSAADARPALLRARVERVPFAEAAAPAVWQVERALTVISGRPALRMRGTVAGGRLWLPGAVIVAYVVDLRRDDEDGAQTLILELMDARNAAEGDVTALERALDRMARSVRVEDNGSEAVVVARYSGDTFAFRVLAEPEPHEERPDRETDGGGNVCLWVSPSGPRTCFPEPEGPGVHFVDLAPDGPSEVFGGVAGGDVFRVAVQCRGKPAIDYLPVPIRNDSGSVKGWAVPVAATEVRSVTWYDAEAAVLGHRPGPHIGPPPST